MMYSRGIRGAITVENDTPESIEKAAVELFGKIIKSNDIDTKDISHVIFTMTKDLKNSFPAKFKKMSQNACRRKHRKRTKRD